MEQYHLVLIPRRPSSTFLSLFNTPLILHHLHYPVCALIVGNARLWISFGPVPPITPRKSPAITQSTATHQWQQFFLRGVAYSLYHKGSVSAQRMANAQAPVFRTMDHCTRVNRTGASQSYPHAQEQFVLTLQMEGRPPEIHAPDTVSHSCSRCGGFPSKSDVFSRIHLKEISLQAVLCASALIKCFYAS